MRIYLSLGSNLGDRLELLKLAIKKISELEKVLTVRTSSFYETPPWGKLDQPPFINCVVEAEVEYTPVELLFCCQNIEKELGRVRHEHWGERTIDIDLLCVDEAGNGSSVVVDTPDLKLPHPYMLQRSFVLVPLAELKGNLLMNNEPIACHVDRLPDADVIKKGKIYENRE